MVKYTRHRIYYLGHLSVHSSVVLSTFTMLCNLHHHLSPELLSSCKTEVLVPLNSNFPSLFPTGPDNHHSTFHLYESNYSTDLVKVDSHSICPFVIGLFHWASCPQSWTMVPGILKLEEWKQNVFGVPPFSLYLYIIFIMSKCVVVVVTCDVGVFLLWTI